MEEKPQIIVTGENDCYTTVTPVLFKTTSVRVQGFQGSSEKLKSKIITPCLLES